MIKTILEPLRQNGFIFKRFEPFSLQVIGSRKRIGVYHGIDTKNRYFLLFVVNRKSRVLQKDVKEWLDIKQRIEHYCGYAIMINIALINAPLCSKAKAILVQEGWKVINNASM
ncbi:hypothetical protein [Hydrogenimonas thermophila]|uniref:Uncharacterized protein n=1 Tax=Hydrogenimonas thermophila TaxID=223786 RepID=A0A1I5MJX3_9BACT|nr:hypothetical protein [Hydrogenimonas thermophila]SFP09882.1 hypothetical protein SAMN05216234_10640 [Hydrogenimonas thermophila]